MKNYYDQQQELQTALYRLESLKEKREMYFNMTQPGSVDYSKEPVEGGVHIDSMTEYTIKIEKIDKEIKQVESEIETLNKYLKKMESCLRAMKGIYEKIFVYKYIDGLNVTQIVNRVNYSQSDVYRKLQIIERIINE